jgi:3'-phosphoadenosine 5'-phosphosulfate sulfotransferase (PAPS reductase)/FAD synthetase
MTNAEFYLQDLITKFNKINPDEYYLSYSGGKDSHLLYWFIKEYAPQFKNIKVVSVNTYMEHHEIRDRIYENADIVLMPLLKPFEIKEKYGIPCFSKMQDDFINRYQKGSRCKSVMERINGVDENGRSWTKFRLNKKARELLLSNKLHRVSPNCCKYLKKEPFKKFEKETGLKAILGVKGTESILRKSQYTSCFTKDKKFTPLYDLTDELEDEIYKQFNIEIPDIYKYVSRTGCMGCPYGFKSGGTEKELQLLDENQHKFVCEYFKESYAVLGIDTNIQMKIGDNI